MAWTAPRTWVAGETVTAALMNTHVRDNLKAIGDAWTSYTPGYSGITIGNATVTAKYLQAGKLVIASFKMVVGSTTTFAATNLLVQLPVSAAVTLNQSVGSVFCGNNASTVFRAGSAVTASSTSLCFVIDGGVFVSNTVPFTWATGDTLSWSATYEAP
jgi:hypothetical protein